MRKHKIIHGNGFIGIGIVQSLPLRCYETNMNFASILISESFSQIHFHIIVRTSSYTPTYLRVVQVGIHAANYCNAAPDLSGDKPKPFGQ